MEQARYLSVAFIGHRNCGKSTLAGKLKYEVKKSQGLLKTLNDFYGKDITSLPPSFLVDTIPEEREKGQTLDLSFSTLSTNTYEFLIYNVPGRRDLIQSMIRGTSQADAAVLVVSALPDEFEVGMHAEGQTRWHPLIAHAFGVEQFIVCITKTDEEEADFSEDRYNEIKKQVSECFEKIGISPQKIQFIPVSGITGENLVNKSKRFNWYKGPTFIEAMKNFWEADYRGYGTLRVTVQKIEKVRGSGDIIGKVQAGTIVPGDFIKFGILNKPMKLFSIYSSSYEQLYEGRAGTTIRFHLPQEIMRSLSVGDIIGRTDVRPPCPCEEFEAEVTIINHPGEIKVGYCPVISIHTDNVQCKIKKIIKKIDKESEKKFVPRTLEDFLQQIKEEKSKELAEESKVLKNGEVALVIMKPEKRLCVEAFHNVPGLARFVIRDNARIIGTGIVKDVVFKK